MSRPLSLWLTLTPSRRPHGSWCPTPQGTPALRSPSRPLLSCTQPLGHLGESCVQQGRPGAPAEGRKPHGSDARTAGPPRSGVGSTPSSLLSTCEHLCPRLLASGRCSWLPRPLACLRKPKPCPQQAMRQAAWPETPCWGWSPKPSLGWGSCKCCGPFLPHQGSPTWWVTSMPRSCCPAWPELTSISVSAGVLGLQGVSALPEAVSRALEGRGPSSVPCGTSAPPALHTTRLEFLDPGRFRQHLIFLFAKYLLRAPVG